MRRIIMWLAATVTIVVLLFGYHTSTNQTSGEAGTGAASAPAAPPESQPSASAPSDTQPSAPTPSSTPSNSEDTGQTKTYTGSIAQTQWGPVQVEVTVQSGKITAVDVVQYPNGNHRDVEINDYALPILVQDTLDAQSAKIDMVSGATVTSDGYLRSLQSALDQAGI